jgi:hypothetical protein
MNTVDSAALAKAFNQESKFIFGPHGPQFLEQAIPTAVGFINKFTSQALADGKEDLLEFLLEGIIRAKLLSAAVGAEEREQLLDQCRKGPLAISELFLDSEKTKKGMILFVRMLICSSCHAAADSSQGFLHPINTLCVRVGVRQNRLLRRFTTPNQPDSELLAQFRQLQELDADGYADRDGPNGRFFADRNSTILCCYGTSGVSAEDLTAFEQLVGIKLPSPLARLYATRNGRERLDLDYFNLALVACEVLSSEPLTAFYRSLQVRH